MDRGSGSIAPLILNLGVRGGEWAALHQTMLPIQKEAGWATDCPACSLITIHAELPSLSYWCMPTFPSVLPWLLWRQKVNCTLRYSCISL